MLLHGDTATLRSDNTTGLILPSRSLGWNSFLLWDGFALLVVAGRLVPLPAEAVVMGVSILLAVEAEGPLLVDPRGVLVLLISREVLVDHPKSVLFVNSLFLSSDCLHGFFFLVVIGGFLATGFDSVQLCCCFGGASFIHLEFVRDLLDGVLIHFVVIKFVPDFFCQSGVESTDAVEFALIGLACFKELIGGHCLGHSRLSGPCLGWTACTCPCCPSPRWLGGSACCVLLYTLSGCRRAPLQVHVSQADGWLLSGKGHNSVLLRK